MSVSRLQALGQYKKLLRVAEKMSNYNFREYAVRVVREDFRAGSKVTDANDALELYQKGRVQLDMLHRQSTISQLFPQGKHAMEA
jgi:LYR motif-containing protein 4|mmetsp:Transcript_27224/g.73171  ORF Transcript_27224/g.73171 Transcript_27224/m.73171 type:complete len:85 (+) Transcript_27224:96-350(+)|eukprot:1764799-Prymnesium_polylepis.1